MKKFLLYSLAILGSLVLLIAIGAAVIGMMSGGKGTVPAKVILEINFEQGLAETESDDPFASFGPLKKPTLRAVLSAIERAGEDQRVVALIAKIGGGSIGLAQVQELRDAIAAFRAKGKTAAETFGEVSPGNGGYYLATAFEQIYLQPSGDIGLTGLIAEASFVRGTFDKLGVVPRMDHRYEYKNAKNTFTETKFTDAHREATQKIIDSLFSQIVKGIAETRNIKEDELRALIDRGPFFGKEAIDAKLVDQLAYRDEAYSAVKEKAGKDAQLLYLGKYLERAGSPYEKGETIALIYGVGGVQRGKSEFNPLSGSQTMGSDTVTAAFRAAIDDKKVKAILFRVDSPGGSYVASDAIWRETLRAKQAGKPVIVSMGNVAGSGGYFVAMAADKIIAQPGTITGSIGVVGGKWITSDFWAKLGITFDSIQTSKNAAMWTGAKDYSKEEWARLQTWLDRVYEDFTGKVAEGRKLPKEKVLAVAKGRIWSGEDAKANGLIDEVGGYSTALKLAREAAKIPADAKIKLKVFPEPKSFVQALLDKGQDSSEAKSAVATLLERLQPVARLAERMEHNLETQVLAMPELGEIR